MREFIVAANWKMNGDRAHALEFCSTLKNLILDTPVSASQVLFPASPYLNTVYEVLGESEGISCGIQSISSFSSGAYTGEVAASMAKDVGCHYALIGHSERRSLFHESNDIIVNKTLQALEAGLRPMICLGESLDERKANQTNELLQKQLLPLLQNEIILNSNFVLAYEPVWAIGTGLAATPDEANDAHHFIRSLISEFSLDIANKTPILYGGSVKPDNAKSIFAKEEVDGALIGGASLNVNSFWEIVTCTNSF